MAALCEEACSYFSYTAPPIFLRNSPWRRHLCTRTLRKFAQMLASELGKRAVDSIRTPALLLKEVHLTP